MTPEERDAERELKLAASLRRTSAAEKLLKSILEEWHEEDYFYTDEYRNWQAEVKKQGG
jgi:hypothetical protein